MVSKKNSNGYILIYNLHEETNSNGYNMVLKHYLLNFIYFLNLANQWYTQLNIRFINLLKILQKKING